MSDTNGQSDLSALSAVDLLTQLKAGALDPALLSSEDRQRCVVYLAGQRLSADELAKLFRVSPRTISRDRAKIREDNALRYDPDFADEMAGRILSEAEISLAEIGKAMRQRDVTPDARINAARTSFAIVRGLVQSLQSMAYLPTAAQQLHASISHTHRHEDVPSYEQILAETRRIIEIRIRSNPDDKEALARLEAVQDQTQRLLLTREIEETEQAVEKDVSDDGTEP